MNNMTRTFKGKKDANQGAEAKYCFSSVMSIPAIVALVKVLMAPVSIALTATREMSALRPGEICDRTPI